MCIRDSTKKVVEFLANHPQVEKVNHPSLPDHPEMCIRDRPYTRRYHPIYEAMGGVPAIREVQFSIIQNLSLIHI